MREKNEEVEEGTCGEREREDDKLQQGGTLQSSGRSCASTDLGSFALSFPVLCFRVLRQFACSWPIRSSTLKTFSSFAETTSARPSTVSTASTMNVSPFWPTVLFLFRCFFPCLSPFPFSGVPSFARDCFSTVPFSSLAYHLCSLLTIAGKRRYNIKLWKTFTDCFNCLPIAAVIDEKILCM